MPASNIILLGSFNPAIFSPIWIRSNNVIDIDDGSEPKIEIIHERVAQFTVSDIEFAIERHRFAIGSQVHDHYVLLDVFNRAFADLLIHTPLRAIGLNLDDHHDVGDYDTLNKLGRYLAPIDRWGPWAADIESKTSELNGGLTKMAMKKVRQPPPLEEYSLVTIEPSSKGELARRAFFLSLNNHYGYLKESDIEDQKAANIAIVEYANSRIDNTLAEYEEIVEHLKNVD